MYEQILLPSFALEGGEELHDVPVAYRSWGALGAEGDNVVVVCHALTGDTDAADWWGPLIGPGRVLDTEQFFVICANVPGSPYGSVSPLTPDPASGRPYGPDLPSFTVRDTVRLHRALLDRLGVRRVALAVGGSMGGMQVLEWAALYGDYVGAIAPMAVGARHSAWCIAWSEMQRQAIFADPRWRGGRYDPSDPPRAGLAAARMAAMISYRSRSSFEERFGRATSADAPGSFDVESYLRYQGEKLVGRFDANCYVQLTRQMDSHDLGRGRGALGEVLGRLRQPALVVGIDSDVLYPLAEQEALAEGLPNGALAVVRSPHGHDAFLIEFDQLIAHLQPWIDRHVKQEGRRPGSTASAHGPSRSSSSAAPPSGRRAVSGVS